MSDFIFKKAVVLICCIMVFQSYAQNTEKSSCSQKLKEMQKSYEQGLLLSIPESLSDCMSGGFTKTEKLQGYRLIILTYLFLDETRNAQKYMNELLVYEPDYQPNKALDPIEYIKLFESYNVLPYFSFGISLGANQSRPNLVNSYTTKSDPSGISEFSNGIGFNFGAAFDYLIVKNLFLSAEGYVYLRNFKYTDEVLENSTNISEESQTSLNIPVTLKYAIGNGKIKPYIRGGAAIDLLLSDQSQMTRVNAISSQNDNAGAAQDMIASRNPLNLYLLAGAGLIYKIGYGYVFLEGRYMLGVSNFSNTSQKYTDFKQKIMPYGYIDPDFGVTNIQISIGYMMSLYKVKIKNKIELE